MSGLNVRQCLSLLNLGIMPFPIAQAQPADPLDEPGRVIWTQIESLIRDFLGALPQLAAGALVLIATWLVAMAASWATDRTAGRTRMRKSLRELLRQLAYVSVWATGILIAVIVVFPGMTVGRAVAVLGLGSIAIGFAFKDIFENFFAGVLILWRYPFEPGDFIRCGEIEGQVEMTTVRMTTVRQTDGQLVVVSNSQIFKDPVWVLTSQKVRRLTVMAGVAYGEDVDASREVIRKAVESCKTVASERPIEIFAKAFGASSIDFEVTWWTGSTPLEERRSRDEVVAAVKRGLDDAGIEIPFPYRTLTFKEPLRIDRTSGEENGHAESESGEAHRSGRANPR